MKDEVLQNESSSEIESFNYLASDNTKASLEAGNSQKLLDKTVEKPRRYSNPDRNSKFSAKTYTPGSGLMTPSKRHNSSPVLPQSINSNSSKNSANSSERKAEPPEVRRPSAPSATPSSLPNLSFDFHTLKSRDNLMRYYDFLRRLYAGNLLGTETASPKDISTDPVKNPLLFASPQVGDRLKGVRKQKSSNEQLGSENDDEENLTQVQAKRFKGCVEGSGNSGPASTLQIPLPNRKLPLQRNLPPTSLYSCTAPNLLPRTLSTYRNPSPGQTTVTTSSTTALSTSTPISLKRGAASEVALKIPKVLLRSGLTPLPGNVDAEQLKPITSTYLQLTRSMGLSDEEALRFDSLVSDDFDYKVLIKN